MCSGCCCWDLEERLTVRDTDQVRSGFVRESTPKCPAKIELLGFFSVILHINMGNLFFPMIITANVFLCINISNRFSPTPAEVVVLPLSRTWVNLAWKIESKRWLESCGSTDVDGYVFLKSFFLKHRYFQ